MLGFCFYNYQNRYSPYGLNLVGIEKAGAPDDKFQYNGKEKQEEFGLHWNDFGARMYDIQLGRFHTHDRFAEKYDPMTPYQYGANNPIINLDINGDSIWTVFTDAKGGKLNTIPDIVQQMFKKEFGIEVGYNSKTEMLYYVNDVESDVSQSETATSQLKNALMDVKYRKYGRLEFGHNLNDKTGNPVEFGASDGLNAQIDLADYNANGTIKGFDYVKVGARDENMARVFEHEFLGHNRLRKGASGDGNAIKTGSVVDATNPYRQERGLLERVNYYDPRSGRSIYGQTSDYASPKAMRQAMRAYKNGSVVPEHYIQRKR